MSVASDEIAEINNHASPPGHHINSPQYLSPPQLYVENASPVNVRPNSRFRRDKSRSSSKLQWNNVSFSEKDFPVTAPRSASSLRVEDYEPSFALRKIALYYEKNMNEEVAQLIKEISLSTLRKIYQQFPIDQFIDGIPQTLTIVNTLYSRLLSSAQLNNFIIELPFKSLLMQIVKLQARNLAKDLPKLKDWDRHSKQLDNLLQVIGRCEGLSSLKMLRSRQRRLQRALESLDEHGLIEVETSLIDSEHVSSQLMSLSSALRVELERMMNNCKISMNKLHRQSRKVSSNLNQGSSRLTPSAAAKFNVLDHSSRSRLEVFECNHQQMLNFTSTSIQDRLYNNKSLLNIVEPTINYAQLPKLVDILQNRIEKDKDVLSTFFDLRKDIISVSTEAKLLSTLQHYNQAFTIVIDTLKEYVPDDSTTPESMSTSGSYSTFASNKHSKNSSNVDYMSQDGSEVRKKRSQTKNRNSMNNSNNNSATTSDISSSVEHNSFDLAANQQMLELARKEAETKKLNSECESLRLQLNDAKRMIEKMKSQEQALLKRTPLLTQNNHRSATPNGVITNGKTNKPLTNGTSNKQTSTLGTAFLNLYTSNSLAILDALEQTWDNEQSETIIKSKVLFSIIVVSYRSAVDTLDRARYQLRNLMCASRSPLEDAVQSVEAKFNEFLRHTCSTYDVSKNIESVWEQICDALYDHPRLRTSQRFKSYIGECVRLSWTLANHEPALALDYDSELFDPCVHRRFSTADHESENIICFLWPALLERETGRCVTHGLVITG